MRCKNPNCKEKFKPKYFLQKHCMEKDECIKLEIAFKKKEKEKTDFKEMKIEAYGKEHRSALQDEINKLSRMIDAKFGYTTCIDCNKPFTGQIDAAHFHSRKENSTLRYNLHNLHSANGYCNQYSENHKSGYKIGLIERYGPKYASYVIEEMRVIYPMIKLSNREVYEKLAIVRKLIRDFNTFVFQDAISAREQLNKIIGIYYQ